MAIRASTWIGGSLSRSIPYSQASVSKQRSVLLQMRSNSPMHNSLILLSPHLVRRGSPRIMVSVPTDLPNPNTPLAWLSPGDAAQLEVARFVVVGILSVSTSLKRDFFACSYSFVDFRLGYGMHYCRSRKSGEWYRNTGSEIGRAHV